MTTEPGAKSKKTLLRKNLDLLLVFLIFTPVYYAHTFTQPISPFEPRSEPYAPYERHYQIGWRFPFITAYFLMTPENYQPEKYSYPLVVMLHGASRHMYGGKVLARPEMREAFPAFVLIPIAPMGFTWAAPQRWTLRPQALPATMDVVHALMNDYGIDRSRVYITGYSLGGGGVYAALARYHGLFAAAVPVSAFWDPALVSAFDDVPIWVVHGRRDETIPVQAGQVMYAALKNAGRQAFYTEYPKAGHDVWVPAYDNPEFWYWLLSQKRG